VVKEGIGDWDGGTQGPAGVCSAGDGRVGIGTVGGGGASRKRNGRGKRNAREVGVHCTSWVDGFPPRRSPEWNYSKMAEKRW
jgi:hypothetical protein